MVYAVYFVVIWRTVYALADLVSRLVVLGIWLFVYISFAGMAVFLDRYCFMDGFIGFMQLRCRNFFPTIKNVWCILYLVSV